MRSHLSLQVRDVPLAADFYARVFGVAPQKRTSVYAKFDLAEPALNFSLVAGSEPSRVSHLGIEAADAEEFAVLRGRLEAAGIPLREVTGSRCCYALQDKLWFSDPDGNAWEVFRVHEQLPVREPAAGENACGGAAPSRQAQSGRAGCC
jgi:catechol 2,3-dioxygenase-like lactoylglutathione lyase family enzyme